MTTSNVLGPPSLYVASPSSQTDSEYALTSLVYWCRPLSPPSLQPTKAFDTQPDRAHSSPSEIPVTPFSSGMASTQSADSQSRTQEATVGSVGPESSLLGHAGSSSALSEPSGMGKPPPAGTSGITSLPALQSSQQGSVSGENTGAAYESGYREGSNAQPAPWPHDDLSNGSAVSDAGQVSTVFATSAALSWHACPGHI